MLLHRQHSIGSAVTLTSKYVSKKQRRKWLFISAVHELFTHCSVVFIQSVLVSKLLLYSHVLLSNGPP